MSEVILHHYELSPFSEKIRRMLAYKGVPWCAVEQPIMAPKPDLTPLTGGYRRIPVMQIGADIYCDTALIVRRLDALYPERPVVPPALAGAAAAIEDWADHRVFMQAVPPTLVALVDHLPPGFLEDREAMTPGFSKDALFAAAPQALHQCGHSLDSLEQQLAATPFMLGDTFSVADAACFHVVNFLRNNPELVALIEQRPALGAWLARIEDFGPGKVTAMTPAAALAIATDATPADIDGGMTATAPYALGDKVTIIADDYGQETTTGEVVRVSANEITVTREDPALGTLAVHYPRAGYRVSTGG